MKFGVDFGPIIYHDGQKFLVPADSGIETIADLEGKRICVLPNTTTQSNVISLFAEQGYEYMLMTERRPGEDFQDNGDVIEAYLRQRCDAMSSDESQLVSRQLKTTDPLDHRIIPAEPISYEPLAAAYAQGDDQWRQVVNYAIWATIYAEQLGIDKQSVAEIDEHSAPLLRQFTGQDPAAAEAYATLGLAPTFARDIIQTLGNYGEIYNAHLGALIEERGPNQVWSLHPDGRLFSPPFTP